MAVCSESYNGPTTDQAGLGLARARPSFAYKPRPAPAENPNSQRVYHWKRRPLEVPPIIGSAARHSPISHALHLHARPLAGPSPGPFTCTTALRRSLWQHAMVITVTGLVASCPRLVTSRPSSGLVASRPSSGLVTSRRRVARRKGAGSARWQAISSCHGGTVQRFYESILAGGGSSAR